MVCAITVVKKRLRVAVERCSTSVCCGGSRAAKSLPNLRGRLVDLHQAGAIGGPLPAVRPHQLAVDEVDDSRPRRARGLVGGNDLLADRFQRSAFGRGEKAPRRLLTPPHDTSAPHAVAVPAIRRNLRRRSELS